MWCETVSAGATTSCRYTSSPRRECPPSTEVPSPPGGDPAEQPGPCGLPFSCHRRPRDGNHFGHFLLRQPADISKLHDLTLPGTGGGQLAECLIESQQIAVRRFGAADPIVQRDSDRSAWALPPVLCPRMIDQDSAHHLCRHAKEVRSILPHDTLLTHQSQVGLVDEGGWLQGVIGAFAAEIGGRAPPELLVDERQQFLPRMKVAVPPRPEQACHHALIDVYESASLHSASSSAKPRPGAHDALDVALSRYLSARRDTRRDAGGSRRGLSSCRDSTAVRDRQCPEWPFRPMEEHHEDRSAAKPHIA